MSKSDALENGWLLLEFNNVGLANIGDAIGLRPSSAAGNFYLSLHTADPGEAGSQTTNEVTYGGYARIAVARSSGGFTVTANAVNLVNPAVFPTGSSGGGTATHFGIGTASSGAGVLLRSGTLTPNATLGAGETPIITTAAGLVTED